MSRPTAVRLPDSHQQTPHSTSHEETTVTTALRRRPSRRAAALALPIAAALAVAGCAEGEGVTASAASGGEELEVLALDYAYYNPASLVLKEQGWLEQELEDEGTRVEWVLSAGSNKANEALRGGAVQLGSTAGAAALLARANGSPIQVVDVLAQPEWSALVVPGDSPAQSVADLRGATIAATLGTDPYFFLLQTLEAEGVGVDEVEIVNLQHADGRAALARGDVDAWAGLDPHMAAAEAEDGARLLARAPERNTYSVLNAREDFAEQHPEVLATVLEQYERARQWIEENPDGAVTALATAASLEEDLARVQLVERTDFSVDPAPGDEQRAVLERIIPVLVAEGSVRSEEEAEEALDTLFRPEPVTAAVESLEEAS